jgi:hypothetical protein
MDGKKIIEEAGLRGSTFGGEQEKGASAADDAIVVRNGMRVHPQPTSDPLDPLNWSTVRKHSILTVVCLLYFLFTYITTTT